MLNFERIKTFIQIVNKQLLILMFILLRRWRYMKIFVISPS